MKLLSPKEVRDANQGELTKQILRAKETQEIVDETNLKLAKAEADFNAMLAKNRVIWAKEEEEHSLRLQEMKKELKSLEEQEELQELLETKLSDVADREQKVAEEEKRQKIAKEGLEGQILMMKQGQFPPMVNCETKP